METAALSEAEKAEYCRRRELYPEQIDQWRQACEQANDWEAEQSRRQNNASREHKRQAKALEKELKRKEAALAETAALLTLRKKAEAIWGDGEAD